VSRSQHHSERKNTIAALDGVRAIACLSVIEYHIHYLIGKNYNLKPIMGRLGSSIVMAGWAGVTLFFVLSGFLLFLPYARYLLYEQQFPSTRSFYLRRALRILPGYYLALLVLILWSHRQYLQLNHLPNFALFLTFFMDAPSVYQKINGPFWTLAIECQFYMLLPFLAWGCGMLVKHGKSACKGLWLIIICLSSLILWGIGTRFLGFYYIAHPQASLLVPRSVLNIFLLISYGSSGKYLEDFAVGMLCCTLYIYTRNASREHPLSEFIYRHSTWFWGAGILLLFFMAGWSGFYNELLFLNPFIGAHRFLTEFGYAAGFGLCIAAILFGTSNLRVPFEWKPLRWIGSISFSLYLWHLPILLFFRANIIDTYAHSLLTSYLLYLACVAFVIVPFSYLLYRFIELPFMKLSHHSRSQPVETLLSPKPTPVSERALGSQLPRNTVPLRSGS
jgi:peptidoglycan/LPS O-acetylase OafA/YrhL